MAVGLLEHSVTAFTAAFEAVTLLLCAWYSYLLISRNLTVSVRIAEALRTPRMTFKIAQFLLFFVAFIIILDSTHYYIPLEFFGVMMVLYFMAFLEVFYFRTSLAAFVTKLAIIQVMMIESFAFVLQSVGTIDDFRDFFIANFILSNSGGFPRNYTNNIWYDYSPMASISYAIDKLITGIPLLEAELISGFIVSFLSVMAIGAISFKFFSDRRTAMLSMLIACLVPFFWEFTTLPRPEMFALPLTLLVVALVLNPLSLPRAPRSTVLTSCSILGATVVLTHGGMAIEMIAVLAATFFVAKNTIAGRAALITGLILILYSFYATVVGNLTGASLLLEFFNSIISPTNLVVHLSLSTVGTPYQILMEISQAATQTYWWIFLGLIAWIGFLEIFKAKKLEKNYLVFLLVTFALFFLGVVFIFQPVAQGEATRYISLISYLMICVPASSVLILLGTSRAARRFFIPFIVALLIVLSVTNVWIAPNFWQDIGQNSYSGFRLVHTEVMSEIASQSYLNRYDNCYPVVANYVPEFVNLTSSCFGLSSYIIPGETYFNSIGVSTYLTNTPSSAPYAVLNVTFIVLYSARIALFAPSLYGDASPQSDISPMNSTIIYSNGISFEAFINR